MKIVQERGSVYFNNAPFNVLEQVIASHDYSSIYIIVDSNTKKHCLAYLLSQIALENYHIIEISAGESHKNIATCMEVWGQLSSLGADRSSLIINLGGGVVTDLGGFVATTFKRGIEFINVPTSLLSIVDASVGGKNGVDLGSLKNQIGIIKEPLAVLVDTNFLKTLPTEELISGYAEMIKHGLIHSETYLQKVWNASPENIINHPEVIWDSILIKHNVVTQDPTEQGLRKTLNFGHTLGHAIESYCMEDKSRDRLLHGEAIAIGMILALFISKEMIGFDSEILTKVTKKIKAIYGSVSFSETAIETIISLLIYDKKNRNGKVLFVLLESIGQHKLGCEVPNSLIYKAFNFYEKS